MQLRTELRIVQEARDILNKSGGVLRDAEPMRCTFIAAKKAEHTVTILCRCLWRDAQWCLCVAGPPRIPPCPRRSPM